MTYYLVCKIYAVLSFPTFYFLISFFSSFRHPTDHILPLQHANYVDFLDEGSGSVGWASGCHAGGREFDSGRTNTQGLKITEKKVLPL